MDGDEEESSAICQAFVLIENEVRASFTAYLYSASHKRHWPQVRTLNRAEINIFHITLLIIRDKR